MRSGSATFVGNNENAAAIEVQTFPFSLRFEQRMVFAVTGADGNPDLDGSELLAWCAYVAEPGQVLELKQPPRLARSYISLGGGLDIPVVMGSQSTSLRGGFGNAGRPLAKGDRITVGEDAEMVMLPAPGLAVVEPSVALRDVFPATVDGALPIRALPAGEHDLSPEMARLSGARPGGFPPEATGRATACPASPSSRRHLSRCAPTASCPA